MVGEAFDELLLNKIYFQYMFSSIEEILAFNLISLNVVY